MVPAQIEDYRIVRELGSGGMGTVYEAAHVELGTRVAIKVVRPEHVRDLEIEQRFLNEARALSRVAHPGIVQIHSFGVLLDGSSYLVMELLNGETLAQRWKHGRDPDLVAELRLLQPITDVLALLHRSGVVHRDLKPDEVCAFEKACVLSAAHRGACGPSPRIHVRLRTRRVPDGCVQSRWQAARIGRADRAALGQRMTLRGRGRPSA